MSVLGLLRATRRTLRAQWLPPDEIRDLQERKLRRLVRVAHRTVPYYRTQLDEAGVDPESIRGLADLPRLPVTTKADLQSAPAASVLAAGADPARLHVERSSGSTGRPFEVRYDDAFADVRNSLFLRALGSVGYRPGRKLLLVSGPRSAPRTQHWLRWRYVSILEPPERLVAEYARFRPAFLYGCVTPLRLLAEELTRDAGLPRTLRAVCTTAETLDAPTRRFLADAFRCEVFDFYGLSEMGLIGHECREHDGYHLADDAVIVEALPVPGDGDSRRLVMTNLDSHAMPLIRFESGDLGQVEPGGTCPCGRGLSRLRRLDGRAVDCLQLRDGRRISPYRLTCELEKLPGIGRYQVVQGAPDTLTVNVEPANGGGCSLPDDIRNILRTLLGDGVTVEVAMLPKLVAVPGRKFRVVESRLGGL